MIMITYLVNVYHASREESGDIRRLFSDRKNNARISLFVVGRKTQSVRARRDIRDNF